METELEDEAATDAEIRRLQDGIRDHLIALGAPDSLIDGAGCDSGDPLDFTKAEITQAFNYFQDHPVPYGYWPTLLNRGDGVDGHYCIGRRIDVSGSYSCWEFWNEGRWLSAGEVFVGADAAMKTLDQIRARLDEKLEV